LPPDQRVEEFTKLIVHDSIKGVCLKKGLSVTSKIARIGRNIAGSIIRNKPLAKNFIRATKTYLDLCKRYTQEVAHQTLNALKQNPSLVEESRDLGKVAAKVAENVSWTDHGHKHVPQKGFSWKKIVKSTVQGNAKYSPFIKDIEAFERNAWETGTLVATKGNGKTWKVKVFDFVCGAYEGKETKYMRIECSAGVIHGHPISEAKYKKLLKRK